MLSSPLLRVTLRQCVANFSTTVAASSSSSASASIVDLLPVTPGSRAKPPTDFSLWRMYHNYIQNRVLTEFSPGFVEKNPSATEALQAAANKVLLHLTQKVSQISSGHVPQIESIANDPCLLAKSLRPELYSLVVEQRLGELKRQGLQCRWIINKVKDMELHRLYLVLGHKRGEPFDESCSVHLAHGSVYVKKDNAEDNLLLPEIPTGYGFTDWWTLNMSYAHLGVALYGDLYANVEETFWIKNDKGELLWGSEQPQPAVHRVRIEGAAEFAEYHKKKVGSPTEGALPFGNGSIKVAPQKDQGKKKQRSKEERRPPLLHPSKTSPAVWQLCSINGMLDGNAPVPFPKGFTFM